jgi:hypothetical protein
MPYNNTNYLFVMIEMMIDQLTDKKRTDHPGSSLRLDKGARIFLDLFQDLTTLCFQ